MSKANDIFGPGRRPTATQTVRNTGEAYDPLAPVMRSVIGIISESAGLVRHVAALGVVLVLDTDTEPKRRRAATPTPAPDATNIIRFPAARTTKPRK